MCHIPASLTYSLNKTASLRFRITERQIRYSPAYADFSLFRSLSVTSRAAKMIMMLLSLLTDCPLSATEHFVTNLFYFLIPAFSDLTGMFY